MNRIGVVGAGTMGAGIAQVAAQAGFEVLLYDVADKPLEAGLARVSASLDRFVQRGKLSDAERDGAMKRIATTTVLEGLSGADFVIEAAPESLDLKRHIFATLDRCTRPEVILATNTSSLSVTEIAAFTNRPELVVGMHFFNPAPLMQLVEVIAGVRTSEETAQRTMDLTARLQKTGVRAKDTPGFIVNRIGRPFSGEALRMLGENIAGIGQIDRAARLAAGFRMGPFELMDLIGMDINFAVNRSVFEQYFYEPRFRPHPLQAQRVKANLLGRKTGAGWYTYVNDQIVDGPKGAEYYANGALRLESISSVWVDGDPALANLAREVGYTVSHEPESADVIVWGDSSAIRPIRSKPGALILVEASYANPSAVQRSGAPLERVVGYGGVPSVAKRQLIEVAVGTRTAADAWQDAARFFRSLGRDIEVIHDGPGLIAPRMIACLANEAAYALMEGVATVADIDTAVKLGLNHPHGPLEWADAIGPDKVLAILTHLQLWTGDDRYRPCPLLRQIVLAEGTFYTLCHA